MKLGAFECVQKTDPLEALALVVGKAGEAHRRKRDLERASRYVSHQSAAGPDFASLGFQPYDPPKPAPGFALPDLDGKTTRLEDFRGKVLLLFYWATW